jgi:signal transduction histidine kinase
MNGQTSELEEFAGPNAPSFGTAWERRGHLFGSWLPYVTLGSASILFLILSRQTWQERGVTLALAALAAGWVYGMYTRLKSDRSAQQLRMIVYFSGFLLLASVLMSHHPIFLVFAVTGLLHAAELRPWPLVFLGVGLTSILINTITTGFPWQTQESWLIFGAIIILQTLAISFGVMLSNRLNELSEQRRQAVGRLEAALEENARLHAQMLAQARETGVFQERQRLAREIHDTLAQAFLGIITQLGAVQQSQNRPDDQQRHLENAMLLAREGLAEARRAVKALPPEPLESASLPDALAKVAQQWSHQNGVPVEVTNIGDPLALHPEIEAALLRTAQEALSNVARHAKATRVGVTLSYIGDWVLLDVRDDGIGFAADDHATGRDVGFGLNTMRQRVSRVAGTLTIESEPGGGTAISARVPAIATGQEAVMP